VVSFEAHATVGRSRLSHDNSTFELTSTSTRANQALLTIPLQTLYNIILFTMAGTPEIEAAVVNLQHQIRNTETARQATQNSRAATRLNKLLVEQHAELAGLEQLLAGSAEPIEANGSNTTTGTKQKVSLSSKSSHAEAGSEVSATGNISSTTSKHASKHSKSLPHGTGAKKQNSVALSKVTPQDTKIGKMPQFPNYAAKLKAPRKIKHVDDHTHRDGEAAKPDSSHSNSATRNSKLDEDPLSQFSESDTGAISVAYADTQPCSRTTCPISDCMPSLDAMAGLEGHCFVCLDKVSESEHAALDCGHSYCSSCLSKKLQAAVEFSGMFPATCCNLEVPIVDAEVHLPQDLYLAYSKIQSEAGYGLANKDNLESAEQHKTVNSEQWRQCFDCHRWIELNVDCIERA
jgi:hypothetical protein